MTTIPKNIILQSKGLGDTIGDILDSFNLDLSSNYGAIKCNRTKSISSTGGSLSLPISILNFDADYYLLCNDYLYKGGLMPGIAFENSFTDTSISEAYSDMKVFNENIYISAADSIWKGDGSSFTEVITTNLTSSIHILETFTNSLYITDSGDKVFSISTVDVLTTTGAGSIDLALESYWQINSLREVGNYLYIGLNNERTGKGLVYSWDGSSTIPNSKFELEAGVVAGCVLDNIFYIMDTQGILKKYAGNTFVEVARLPKKSPFFFNEDYIHRNGMKVTDKGTILILLSNQIHNIDYEDNIPSGIWEYDKNVGLYHKYGLSISSISGTTLNDYGQQRLKKVGALCLDKQSTPTLTENGTLLAGANYYTGASVTSTSGIFCDDTFDTTTKWGYFITSKIFGKIQEQWSKIYAIYKNFINSTSEIIIKYRTEEDIPTTTTITWVDIDRFTSSVSLSSYSVGDEVQVLQGTGSGQSAHIKEINGSTYILDENFPTAVIGLTSIANVSKWIKVGKITSLDEKQFKGLTISTKNLSPFIQFKVCMKFNGKDELNKLEIINKEQIKEQYGNIKFK